VKCPPHSSEFVALLGLYYYKARFYDPSLGRFLQTDPVGTADDLNLYAYVGNNPVNRVDPTGLGKVVVGDAIQVAGKTPNEGAAGSWYTNPGSGQMRLYGNDGKRAVDLDFDHDHDHGQGVPHAHNYSINPLGGPLIRGPGLPFSILP
jgi:RHS repeat-associated protein